MILHFDVKIKDLIEAGKDYAWPRPAACPCCDGRIWGHGYTARYFCGYGQGIWLKRYRCIACHAVYTLRPKIHWRRFQATVAAMVHSLRSKIVDNIWQEDFSRQRQQYWFTGFKRQIAIHHPSIGRDSFQHLKKLLTKNIIAATHSLRWFRMILRGPWALVVPV